DRAMGLSGPGAALAIERDLGVPMPDGVVLLGDRYRPAATIGAGPVVLMRSPYGRAGVAGAVFAAPLARPGVQGFIQSTRGTSGWGGECRRFWQERPGGPAAAGGRRARRWGGGGVSMPGASSLGHTRWALAPSVAPPLESISLHITAARITAAFYEN